MGTGRRYSASGHRGPFGRRPRPNLRVFASDSLLGHLYASPDGGDNWHTFDRGNAGPRITTLHLSTSGELLAGTLSEGIHLIHNPVE